MKCYKCGAEVTDNVSVCPKCGEKLVEESSSLDDVVKSIKEDNKGDLNLNTVKPEETYKEFIFPSSRISFTYWRSLIRILRSFSRLFRLCF